MDRIVLSNFQNFQLELSPTWINSVIRFTEADQMSMGAKLQVCRPSIVKACSSISFQAPRLGILQDLTISRDHTRYLARYCNQNIHFSQTNFYLINSSYNWSSLYRSFMWYCQSFKDGDWLWYQVIGWLDQALQGKIRVQYHRLNVYSTDHVTIIVPLNLSSHCSVLDMIIRWESTGIMHLCISRGTLANRINSRYALLN